MFKSVLACFYSATPCELDYMHALFSSESLLLNPMQEWRTKLLYREMITECQ